MQFRDLAAQYAALKEQIDQGIAGVIGRHTFILGPQVQELERRLAAYAGVRHCVACASGTDALILPLMAWGVGPGDAVFAPDFTYFASVNCAMLQGATPVLVDIDPVTFNMSPDALEAAVRRTVAEGKLTPRVVIPVDLFGLPADHQRIRGVADAYGMRVLEDAAQGFGGSIGGRMAGSFGDAGATSFFPAKPLGCYGDGGAIFTDDPELAAALRSLRAQGASPADKYDNVSIGLNSRLDAIQAAILLPKLDAFSAHELDDVNRVASAYDALLSGAVQTPVVPDGYRSSWAQYTILLADRAQRDRVRAHLADAGVPSMIYYPRGMHQQTAVIRMGAQLGSFPHTEHAVDCCLSLPMGPYLTEDDQKTVAALVKEALR